MTDAEHLKIVGEALFGTQWQTDLARAIKVSSRSVRNWSAGAKMPEAAWKSIAELCEIRASAIVNVIAGLEERL